MSRKDTGANGERPSRSRIRLLRGLHPPLLAGAYVALALMPLALAALARAHGPRTKRRLAVPRTAR